MLPQRCSRATAAPRPLQALYSFEEALTLEPFQAAHCACKAHACIQLRRWGDALAALTALRACRPATADDCVLR